jgi:hypothetical protein
MPAKPRKSGYTHTDIETALATSPPKVQQEFARLREEHPGFPSDRILLALATRPELADVSLSDLLALESEGDRLAELKKTYPSVTYLPLLNELARFGSHGTLAEHIVDSLNEDIRPAYVRTCLSLLLNDRAGELYGISGDPKPALKTVARYFKCTPPEIAPEPDWLIASRREAALIAQYPQAPRRSWSTSGLLKLISLYESVDHFVQALVKTKLLGENSGFRPAKAELLELLEGKITGYDEDFGENGKPSQEGYKARPLVKAIDKLTEPHKATHRLYLANVVPNPFYGSLQWQRDVYTKNYPKMPPQIIELIATVEYEKGECSGGARAFIQSIIDTPPLNGRSAGIYTKQLDSIGEKGIAYQKTGSPIFVASALANHLNMDVEQLFPRAEYDPGYNRSLEEMLNDPASPVQLGERKATPDAKPGPGAKPVDRDALEDKYLSVPNDFIDVIAAAGENFTALAGQLPSRLKIDAANLLHYAVHGGPVIAEGGRLKAEAAAILYLVNDYRGRTGAKPISAEGLFRLAKKPGAEAKKPGL